MPAALAPSRLLACGILASSVFLVVTALQLPPGYDPLRHPVSALALGPDGWVQTLNLVVTGSLLAAFALGLWRSPARGAAPPTLMSLATLGIFGVALFATDPVSGYPPGTAAMAAGTPIGLLHNTFAGLFFVALAATALVAANRTGRTGFARYSMLSTVAVLAGCALAGLGFMQVPVLVNWAGLLQRVAIIAAFAWLAVFSALSCRAARS